MDGTHAGGLLNGSRDGHAAALTSMTSPAASPTHGAVWSTGLAAAALFGMLVMLALLGGCAGRVALLPNSDPALNKTPPQFAADAAKRHPYHADAPRAGEAPARAAVDYDADAVQIVNLSDEDWRDVEVWVNGHYVVHVPTLEKGAQRVKTLNFGMLYDDGGRSFPTNNTEAKYMVKTVEVYRDGKMYDVRVALAN